MLEGININQGPVVRGPWSRADPRLNRIDGRGRDALGRRGSDESWRTSRRHRVRPSTYPENIARYIRRSRIPWLDRLPRLAHVLMLDSKPMKYNRARLRMPYIVLQQLQADALQEEHDKFTLFKNL